MGYGSVQRGHLKKLSVLNDMVFLRESFENCHFEFEQSNETKLFPCNEIEWRVKYLSEDF